MPYRPLFFFLFLSLLACHQQKVKNIPSCTPPPCEVKQPYSIDPLFSARQKAAIRGAAADWYEQTEHRVCLFEDKWEEDPKSNLTIKVNRALDTESLVILTNLDGVEHAIGLYRFFWNDIWIVTDAFPAEKIEGIAAHEFGHALGLFHTIDIRVPSVMHPVVDPYAINSPHVYEHDYGEYCRLRGCKCLSSPAQAAPRSSSTN